MKKEDIKIIKQALSIVLERDEAETSKRMLFAKRPSEQFFTELDKRVQRTRDTLDKRISVRAAIAVIIAAALILSAMSVTAYAFREEIKGAIFEFFEDRAKKTYETEPENKADMRDVHIEYIPEGFTQTRKRVDEIDALYEWKRGEEIITLGFIGVSVNGSYTIDTENSNFTFIELNGITMNRTEKYGQVNLNWDDGRINYVLGYSSVIEWDEIVKIIEGIKHVEAQE